MSEKICIALLSTKSCEITLSNFGGMTTLSFFYSVDDIIDFCQIGFAFMPVRETSITLFAVLWTKYGITETEIIIAEQEQYYYTYIVTLRSPFSHIELLHWKQCSYMAYDNITYNVLTMYSSYCPRFIYKIWMFLD